MKILHGIEKIVLCLSGLIPRKKDLWVFGAWDGRLFADNSKYLFEFVNNQHPEINAVWITKDEKVRQEIETKGYICYLRSSIKGIIYAIRAEVAFITSDERGDISRFVNRKRTTVIELWHGIAPKGMKWSADYNSPVFRKRFQQYYWMASSLKYQEIFEENLQINPEKFFITGYPRNDTFITKPKNIMVERIIQENSEKKLVIYMPTHRNYGKKPIDISEFPQINDRLKENNIIMVYKPHFNELKNISENNSQLSNIIIAKEQNIWGDVYSYIHYFDLLISDYSSIVYDFLCADKPIVLYTYDIEYMKTNDFGIMDYFETIPPGPFCKSWAETLDQTIKLLEKDTWHEKRNQCREMFHPFKDGRNAERVYKVTTQNILKREKKTKDGNSK